jgi:O-antigen/teichoic acid export membrane protein
MAKGAIWMVLAKLAERSLGTISTLVLARVLIPKDFGIVAMAMSFVALLELINAFGFDTTLIQKQSRDRDQYDTAWTFNIILGFAVAVSMILLARPIALFYREPALTAVILALALGSAAQGFQNIGVVAFRSEMEFNKEFAFLVGKKLIGFFITIPLAFTLHSYWALVIGQVAGRAGSTLLSFMMHPYRPRWTLKARHDLLNFSKWLMISNCLGYLRERSSDWVIGRASGPISLGTFNVAYELAALPSSELAAPINRAVFPGYTKLATEGGLGQGYLAVMGVIALLVTPAVFGLASTASLVVPLVLGPSWLSAIPILVVLSFFGLTMLAQTNAHAAYLALGRAKLAAQLNMVHVSVQLGAMIPLTYKFGAMGAASAYLVVTVVMIPISIGVTLRLLKLSVPQFMAVVWRPLVAAGVMYAVVYWFVTREPAASDPGLLALQLAPAVLLGAVLYIGLVSSLWVLSGRPDGAERLAVERGLPMLQRMLKRRSAVAARVEK